MGLLDFASDPQGMQGLALLAAAGPSMTPMNGASRIALAGSTYRGLLDDQLKQQFTKAQIDDAQQQIGLRNAQLQMAQQKQALLNRLPIFGGGGAGSSGGMAAPSAGMGAAPGGGFAAAGVPGSGAPGGASGASGFMQGMSPDDLFALNYVTGQDNTPLWKIAKEGIPVNAGTYTKDAVTGALRYNADPTKGITLDAAGNVVSMPNALQTQAMTTLATEAPKTMLSAASTLNLRKNADGTESPVPALSENPQLQQMLQGIFGGGQPMQTGSADASRAAGDVAALQREIAAARTARDAPQTKQMRLDILNGELAKAQARAGPLAYGMTNDQAARADAFKGYVTGQGKSANDEAGQIDAEAKGAADFAKRIADMRDIMNFDPSAGTPVRKKMAEYAQSLGAPAGLVNGIAGGDLASIQTFQKMAVTNAMEALKSDMAQGRITQSEFQVYKENQPNVGLLRQATENIFSRAQERNALALDKQQEYQRYRSVAEANGQVPVGFSAYWNKKLMDSGKVKTDSTPATPNSAPKTVVRTGLFGGRKVVQYSDGTTSYAN